jgi:hypothetical protein
MYCPHCGADNEGDINFCRKCGEDLRLSSQAMRKRIGWGDFLSTKLDDSLAGRYRKDARDGGINIFIGLISVLLGLWYVFTGQGALYFWVIVLLCSALGVGVGFYDVLIYRRAVRGFPREEDRLPDDLSIFKAVKSPPPKPREIEAAQPTSEIVDERAQAAPPSVTETTTRRLDTSQRGAAENL